MSKNYIKNLTKTAMIASIYVVLTFLLLPVSFGPLQFRISESLMILPLFTPLSVIGLTMGCFIANLLGAFLGQTILWDCLFGTLATFFATQATYFLWHFVFKKKGRIGLIISLFPPVIFNAFFVALQNLLFFGNMRIHFALFLTVFCYVFISESVVCYGFGLPFYHLLQRKYFSKRGL